MMQHKASMVSQMLGSSGGSTDDVDPSSASGTACEQAKKIMENYDKDAAKADGAGLADVKCIVEE